jgi:sugar lactone lactonase YvrE
MRRLFLLCWIIGLSACSIAPLSDRTTPTSIPVEVATVAPTAIALTTDIRVESGGFSLSYPEGWITREISATLSLAADEAALERNSPGEQLVVTIDSTPIELLAAQYGEAAVADPETFFEVSSGGAQQAGYTLSATRPVSITGYPGLLADLNADGGAGRLAVFLTPDVAIRILGQANPTTWSAQSDLFDAILESIATFPPIIAATPIPAGAAEQPLLIDSGPPNFVLRLGGSSGPRTARFVSARGMAADPDGTIYLAESGRGIWVFEPDGTLRTTFGGEELLDAYDIARAANSDIFVADYGRNAIVHFRSDGTFIARFGSAGDEPEQFGISSPQRLALGPNGDIYALDSRPDADGNVQSSVIRFQSDGTFVERIELPTDLAPADLAIDASGNIYLADPFAGAVIKIAPDGEEMARFGDPSDPARLAGGAIDIDAQGHIYVATYGSGVLKLATTGRIIAGGGESASPGNLPAPGQFSLPNGIVAAPGGVVWVSDNTGEYSAISALRLRTDPEVAATAAAEATVLAITATPEATPVPIEALLRQWADTATASSFYAPDYDPEGATGPPDVAGCQDSPDAWASSDPNGLETLELSYETPVFARAISVHQNHHPGFISMIELIDERGETRTVYQGTPGRADTCPQVLTIEFEQTLTRIVGVRLTIDQRSGADWSEIDAVELVGLP